MTIFMKGFEFFSDGNLVMRRPLPGSGDVPAFVASMANPFLANRTAYMLNGEPNPRANTNV